MESTSFDNSGERISELVVNQLAQHEGEILSAALIERVGSELAETIGLVGVREAAAVVGVTPQRISQLGQAPDHLGFPRPITKLGTSALYLRSDIVEFSKILRRRGRRPKQGSQ